MAKPLVCKDCVAAGRPPTRPAKHPGPRCATDSRAFRRRQRDADLDRYLRATYNISAAQYWELYDAQGGRCFGCQWATGATKRLAVDHDHACCPGSTSCGECVRGLLCKSCNRGVLGHLRDDADALRRLADYLENPPARAVLFPDSDVKCVRTEVA